MTSLTTSLIIVLLSTVVQHGVVANSIGRNGVAAGGSGGRSNNFRRLEFGEPTLSPTPTDTAQFEFSPETSTSATLVATTTSGSDNDEVGGAPPSPNDNDAAPTGPGGEETGTPPPALPCLFCAGGIPDLELVPDGTDGKNCAEVKGYADENLSVSDVCMTVIQPLQSVCCPHQSWVSDNGLPPAVGGGGVTEEVATTTTTAAVGGEGEGSDFEAEEGNDTEEVPTTPAPDIGGEANDFVGDLGNAENATTAATSQAIASSAATPAAISLNTCLETAEYEGNEDPLYTCCATHAEEEICQLNSCMDFESGVITCQCKKVKGIGKDIFYSNDPMTEYLPDDFGGFLDIFHKCCPSSDISPAEFNDCYYDEISEEIIEELEKEFEEQPTYKPTPRPSSVYTPKNDDEDPISKEGEEDFSNGQKDDSLQGVINTYLDGVESPDEMKSDKNVQVVSISLVVVFLVLLLLTAHLVMEHPDGLCASICRLILKCLCCVIRVLCLPCRAICCKGSDQTRNRRTHAPMRAPFPSDLELA